MRTDLRNHTENDKDEADKSLLVVGGFGESDPDEAEELAQQALSNTDGFQGAYSPDGKIALAQISPAMKALKFLKAQKRNQKFQNAGLWANEKRSREDWDRGKVTSKVKKYLIEMSEIEPKNIIVQYKSFTVCVRVKGILKLQKIVRINEEAKPEWEEGEHAATEPVRSAIDELVEEMEL